jgi:hypothetical protein
MTDALIKAGSADNSCARACYVGLWHFSAFDVASVFLVATRFYSQKLFIVAYSTVRTKLLTLLFPLKYRVCVGGGGGAQQVNYGTTRFVHDGAQDPRNAHKSGCSQTICWLTVSRFMNLGEKRVPSYNRVVTRGKVCGIMT